MKNFIATSNVNGYEVDNRPITNISCEHQLPFIKIVDQILSITKDEEYLQNPQKQTKIKQLEKEIDKIMYELYGLTEKKIKIIESD